MADDNDIPPVPLPPADVKAASSVPPIEAAPAVPQAAPAPDAAAPAGPPIPPAPTVAPAYGAAPAAPAYGAPPAAPAYGAPPAQPGYGQPTGAYSQPAYAAQPAGPAQGLAVTSMVLGIAGIVGALFWLGFLPAIAAVITGHLAKKRQPWARGFWLTGLITGYVGIGIAVVTLLGFLAILAFSFSVSNY